MPELGFSGLQEYSGIIQEDFLKEWRLPQSYKNANEMRLNSPIVAALLNSINQSVLSCEWAVTSEKGEDDPRVELWETCARLMEGGLDDFIREALSFLPFGFWLGEIVWGEYEGQTIVKKIAPRGQDTVYRWLLDDTGKCLGFVQVAAPQYKQIELPIEKIIHIVAHAERGNPEGRSILRPAWVPYYYCKNIQQIEAIGIERDLAGLPVIQLPQGADTSESSSTSDYSKAAKLVRNIRQDEQAGVVVPNGWTLSLLSTGGSRQFDTDKIITRYEARILMTALAQFLMLGQQNVGSLALSRDQSDLFVMSVNATADTIGEAIQTQLLPRLMALNGYDAEGLTVTHTPAGDMDMAALADQVTKFTQAGYLTPLPSDEAWVRNTLGMPEADPDEIEEAKADKLRQQQEIMARVAQEGPPNQEREQRPQPERTEEQEPEEVEETG